MSENEPVRFVTDVVTADKAIHDRTHALHPNDLPSGPYVEITSADQLMRLRDAARRAKASFDDVAKRLMTEDRARYIRRIRCVSGYSWRSVATACWECIGVSLSAADRWGDHGPESNQLMGIALCEQAAAFLKEDPKARPWN
jgi:hypothetical protein